MDGCSDEARLAMGCQVLRLGDGHMGLHYAIFSLKKTIISKFEIIILMQHKQTKQSTHMK